MRSAAILALAMLGAAAVSWARFAAGGDLMATPATDRLWASAAFGACIAIAAVVAGRAARDDVPWRTAVVAALIIHVAAALALPLTSNDVWSNLAYGELTARGHNAFLVGPIALPPGDGVRALVDPTWLGAPSVYGPLVLAVGWLAAQAPGAIGELVAFKGLLLVVALAAIAIAARVCRDRFADRDARARFVAFAWSPLLAWEVSAQAHNDGIVVVALLGFVWAAAHERRAIAVVCLAAGIASKFVAAPVAALYLVHVARTRPLRAIALAALLAALCIAAMLPWWHGPSTLGALWNRVAPETPQLTRSIGRLLFASAAPLGATAQEVAYAVCYYAGLALAATIGVVGLARVRTLDDVVHWSLVLFLALTAVGMPWFEPWYVLWAMPLALAHRDRRWLALATTYAALVLVAYALPIDPVSNAAIDVYVAWRIVALVRDRQRGA